MSPRFFAIATWLSQRRATLTHTLSGVGSVAEIRFLEPQIRLRQLKREAAALDAAFQGAHSFLRSIIHCTWKLRVAEDCLPFLSEADGRARHFVRAEPSRDRFATQM
jgi:hypothetical protein